MTPDSVRPTVAGDVDEREQGVWSGSRLDGLRLIVGALLSAEARAGGPDLQRCVGDAEAAPTT